MLCGVGARAAAYAAANATGARVALVEASDRIGGMMVPGGIGRDSDDFASAFGAGSFARAWVDENGAAYGVPYVLQPDVVVGNASLWAMLGRAPSLRVFRGAGLVDGPGAVSRAGTVVTRIVTVDPAGGGGTVAWTAAQFVDASYDGDLAVAAGVTYTYKYKYKYKIYL